MWDCRKILLIRDFYLWDIPGFFCKIFKAYKDILPFPQLLENPSLVAQNRLKNLQKHSRPPLTIKMAPRVHQPFKKSVPGSHRKNQSQNHLEKAPSPVEPRLGAGWVHIWEKEKTTANRKPVVLVPKPEIKPERNQTRLLNQFWNQNRFMILEQQWLEFLQYRTSLLRSLHRKVLIWIILFHHLIWTHQFSHLVKILENLLRFTKWPLVAILRD